MINPIRVHDIEEEFQSLGFKTEKTEEGNIVIISPNGTNMTLYKQKWNTVKKEDISVEVMPAPIIRK